MTSHDDLRTILGDFALNDTEADKLLAWILAKAPIDCGPIGGRFTVSFTSTMIGTVIKARDAYDGTEIDVTDYGCW